MLYDELRDGDSDDIDPYSDDIMVTDGEYDFGEGEEGDFDEDDGVIDNQFQDLDDDPDDPFEGFESFDIDDSDPENDEEQDSEPSLPLQPSPTTDKVLPYDIQYSTPLSKDEASKLIACSNFEPMKPNMSGPKMRHASVVQKNIKMRALKPIPHAYRRLVHPDDEYAHVMQATSKQRHKSNNNDDDDDDDNDDDDDDDDEHIEKYGKYFTISQIAAQDYQISSDRDHLGLEPLPLFPPSKVPVPFDENGEPIIALSKTKINSKPAATKKGKRSKEKSLVTTVTTTEPCETHLSIAFEDLGFKQRFIDHLLNGTVSATVYKYLEAFALRYKSKPHTDYEAEKANEIITAASLSESAPFPILASDNKPAQKNKSGRPDHGQLSTVTPSFQNPTQSLLAPFLSSYCDLLYTSPSALDSQTSWDQPRDAYLCHVVNHVLLHRDRVVAHNSAIMKRVRKERELAYERRMARALDKDAAASAQDGKKASTSDEKEDRSLHKPKQPLDAKKVHQTPQTKHNSKRKRPDPLPDTPMPASSRLRTLDDPYEASGGDDHSDTKTGLPSLETEQAYRDQGFTRPCVLIIQPTRSQAYETILRLLDLIPPSQRKVVHGLDRFHEEYGDTDGAFRPIGTNSLDFQLTFKGNNDDCFRIGIQFIGNSVKLFSSMYQSDIIIASPLSLKLILGTAGSEGHVRKADFLSSIQILVVDQLQVLSMQNLDHLMDVLAAVNSFPTDIKDIDFSRVKQWYLDGYARFYRQTVMLTSFLTPQINNIFTTYCENKSGRIRIRPQQYNSILPYIHVKPIKQVFYRIGQADLFQYMSNISTGIQTSTQADGMVSQTAALSRIKQLGETSQSDELLTTAPRSLTQQESNVYDAKFKLWCSEIWPKVKESYQTEGNTVVFVPSSLDFVRIRNEFHAKFVNFVIISEYTDKRLVDNARSKIVENKVKFALVSERYYFYFRSSLKNIRHVVWYAPPTIPNAYVDLANMLRSASHSPAASAAANTTTNKRPPIVNTITHGTIGRIPSCFLIYSQYDALALERIVGTEKCRELLTSKQSLHVIGS